MKRAKPHGLPESREERVAMLAALMEERFPGVLQRPTVQPNDDTEESDDAHPDR